MSLFANLDTAWFALIGLLWTGYFFLEGFDYGVAVITPLVARDDLDKRICLNSVGPVWDGNEVWLLTAGGATFAAFPLWYARLFNGFYLALFLVLLALIVRGVSFEFRHRVDSVRWRRGWDTANFVGSFVPALVWGVAFVDLVHGVPLWAGGRYFGGLIGLLHPVALLGGLASLSLFALHGSCFLALKTSGGLEERARRVAVVSGTAAVVFIAATTAWLATGSRPGAQQALPAAVPVVLAIVCLLLVAGATVAARAGHSGWGFLGTGAGILFAMAAVFSRMFPYVLPASNNATNALSISGAASQHNTLVVMTVVAAIFTPFVLAYQGWTYWVFRQRLVRPVDAATGRAHLVTSPAGARAHSGV